MRIFKKNILGKSAFAAPFIIGLLFLFISSTSYSQVRNYNLIYSDNIKGGTAMFGNTLLNIVKSNGDVNTVKMNGNSSYGNDNENMQYIDIDGSAGNGSVTRNSSSADLSLPDGTNVIKLARLYWGGRIKNSEFDLTKDANKSIKIRKGTSALYANVTALGIDEATIVTGYTQYQAYADVTDFIKNNGAGTYEIGNAPLSTGSASDGGNNGGWCIVVVYENSNLNYNSIRLFDGFEQVYSNGNPLVSTVTLSGLDVPSGALAAGDAKMGVLAWEGDANLNKDFLKINSYLFSNATNSADNPWNGTITDNGVHVTSKNPNYTNQMGIDIDQFDVGTGYGILPNANSVTLEFGTEADKYFPGVFTFTIKMKEPGITLDATVSDTNGNHIGEPNEVLTYTLRGKNSGLGNANSVVITDTLPSAVTYLPNSLKVINAPGVAPGLLTDLPGDDIAEYLVNGTIKAVRFRLGAGASNTAAGILAPGENYEVQFQVTVNDPGFGNRVPSIMNMARIKAVSDAHENFVDDGTAIINPDNGPLPVRMVSFTASLLQDKKIKIDWSTSMEISCAKYIIERSEDGNLFLEAGSVAGNGTSALYHSYSFLDDASEVTNSIIYYRIQQIDIDGKSSFSKILPVKLDDVSSQIAISPNPFNSYLNINMQWNKNEIISAKVISVEGKELFNKKIRMIKGSNYIKIDELSKLPSGNYFIQFLSATEAITKKITKQ